MPLSWLKQVSKVHYTKIPRLFKIKQESSPVEMSYTRRYWLENLVLYCKTENYNLCSYKVLDVPLKAFKIAVELYFFNI